MHLKNVLRSSLVPERWYPGQDAASLKNKGEQDLLTVEQDQRFEKTWKEEAVISVFEDVGHETCPHMVCQALQTLEVETKKKIFKQSICIVMQNEGICLIHIFLSLQSCSFSDLCLLPPGFCSKTLSTDAGSRSARSVSCVT